MRRVSEGARGGGAAETRQRDPARQARSRNRRAAGGDRGGEEGECGGADTHDYDEAATRDAFIDLLLRKPAGPSSSPEGHGIPGHRHAERDGDGFVDYVLWGDDGKPLGLVEAKRTRRDPRVGQQQAKLYADCLEKKFGQRPIIFYTNGYEHGCGMTRAIRRARSRAF